MQSVCVCRGCGRSIDSEFLFCPWCGCEQMQVIVPEQVVDAVFNRIEGLCIKNRTQQISRMERVLNDLDEELAQLIAASEKKG